MTAVVLGVVDTDDTTMYRDTKVHDTFVDTTYHLIF